MCGIWNNWAGAISVLFLFITLQTCACDRFLRSLLFHPIFRFFNSSMASIETDFFIDSGNIGSRCLFLTQFCVYRMNDYTNWTSLKITRASEVARAEKESQASLRRRKESHHCDFAETRENHSWTEDSVDSFLEKCALCCSSSRPVTHQFITLLITATFVSSIWLFRVFSNFLASISNKKENREKQTQSKVVTRHGIVVIVGFMKWITVTREIWQTQS